MSNYHTDANPPHDGSVNRHDEALRTTPLGERSKSLIGRVCGAPVTSKSVGDIHYRPIIGIPGLGPFQGVHKWKDGAPDHLSEGYGFEVTDNQGRVINFLQLDQRDPLTGPEKYLPGRALSGGSIRFGRIDDGVGLPIIVTATWKSAVYLRRWTRSPSVACLFYENVPDVVKALRKQHPSADILICFDGSSCENENPKMRCLFGLSSDVGAEVIPSHPAATYEAIFASGKIPGVLSHIKEVRSLQEPFPSDKGYRYLGIEERAIAWPMRISSGYLLRHMTETIRRYISISDEAVLLISLFIIFTYVTPAFRFSPPLALSSPEAGCGKTTLLYLLRHLCKLATGSDSPSLSDLKRSSPHCTTLFADEAQDLFGNRQAVALIAAGSDRFSMGIITNEKYGDARLHPERAVVLAFLGAPLPDRLVSRCVQINMHRQAPTDRLERQAALLTDIAKADLVALRAMAERWAEENLLQLAAEVPQDLGLNSPRFNDTMSPLMAIAKLLGPEFETQARKAAQGIFTEADDVLERKQLLQDISEALKEIGSDDRFIGSQQLCDALTKGEDSIWKEAKLNKTMMAALLKPYKLRTKDVRKGKSVTKNYCVAALQDAILRYLPPLGGLDD